MARFSGLLGIITILSLAYIFSTNRRAIRIKTVLWGLGLQFVFAWIVVRYTFGQRALSAAGTGVNRLLSYSFAGSEFVFGNLGKPNSSMGFFFAFQVLPTIIFISAFFAVLYHFGIMQFIIKQLARVMTYLMGISGAESLDVAASIFMGQTEAPLTIRPFLPDFTQSELMTIMTAPGTILLAKMLVPETEQPKTAGRVEMSDADMHKDANVLGAIARGTIDGGQLAFNVAIMLISFIALVALLNGIMGGIHHYVSFFPSSIESVLGTIFAPLAWLIGVPGHDIRAVGNLLGSRMVINELYAYSLLGAQKATLDPRSFTIATFALCGFANFSSIGIQLGGIGALAPNKRHDLARLGFRAMLAGTAANLISASIVGILMKS